MAEHEPDRFRSPRVPAAEPGPAAMPPTSSPAAAELAAALEGLDRATRNFTSRLSEGQREVERARLTGERTIEEATLSGAARPQPEAIAEPATGARDSAFDRRLHEAEVEARAYLEAAKRRADSLVTSMIGAIEHEAAQTRRDAEAAIRERWKQVEIDANRQVENARRVAAEMVAERQRRIGRLSDGISERASTLTAGMDDAERVRVQFDAFVRALAAAADRIAREPSGRPQPRPLHTPRAGELVA